MATFTRHMATTRKKALGQLSKTRPTSLVKLSHVSSGKSVRDLIDPRRGRSASRAAVDDYVKI